MDIQKKIRENLEEMNEAKMNRFEATQAIYHTIKMKEADGRKLSKEEEKFLKDYYARRNKNSASKKK